MTEKMNNSAAKWLRIAVEIGLGLFAVGAAWATLNGRIGQNEISDKVQVEQGEIRDKSQTETLNKHENRITATEQQLSDTRADIREIKIKQEYMVKGLDRIEAELKK